MNLAVPAKYLRSAGLISFIEAYHRVESTS